jgi:DNA-binding CsgD family transcriptional regulator
VFIIDPENHRVLSIDRLARLFRLTEAESQLCRLMLEGLSAREIAECRGVGEQTVKTQFKAIYAKTGAHRRAELVRLAVTVDPPIASGRKAAP